MSLDGIPLAMQWEIKRLKVLQKETVTMTPNKTQDVKPGQTIIVDLPYNSKVWSGISSCSGNPLPTSNIICNVKI